MKGREGEQMSGKKTYRTCQARYVATTKKCGEQAEKTRRDKGAKRTEGQDKWGRMGGGINRKKGRTKRQTESDSESPHIPVLPLSSIF